METDTYPETLGFKSGTSGTHTSRTLMFEELSALLTAGAKLRSQPEFARLIVDENLLGKSTVSTRRLSAQRLTELYALDTSVPMFRALLRLWSAGSASQPLLALLLALARDPLLRATAQVVLPLTEGQAFDREAVTQAVQSHAGSRLNPGTTAKVTRNAASSWTQSGHLTGRTFKKRHRVQPTTAATTLALFLGYLQGLRGKGLFRTLWCEALDSTPDALAALASRASAAGFLRFRMSGDVIELSFPDLLTKSELERITHG